MQDNSRLIKPDNANTLGGLENETLFEDQERERFLYFLIFYTTSIFLCRPIYAANISFL